MVQIPFEKLTGLQLVKKFPAFHGTQRFITVLTSVRHLSLSWANPIQSTYPQKRNVMAHGIALGVGGEVKGNMRMEWLASSFALYVGTWSIQHYYQQ